VYSGGYFYLLNPYQADSPDILISNNTTIKALDNGGSSRTLVGSSYAGSKEYTLINVPTGGGINFTVNDVVKWRFNVTTSNLLPETDDTFDIGNGTQRVASVYTKAVSAGAADLSQYAGTGDNTKKHVFYVNNVSQFEIGNAKVNFATATILEKGTKNWASSGLTTTNGTFLVVQIAGVDRWIPYWPTSP
jgi:hypothetical protein